MNHIPLTSYIEDPAHRMAGTPLSDEAYAAAMTTFIIVCVDAMFVNRKRQTVFLATRQHKPMSGLWMIGGRVNADEAFEDALVRKLKRETALTIPPERFELLRIIRYRWKEREQEPQNMGSDNLGVTYAVDVTDEEVKTAAAHIDPTEYQAASGLREFDRSGLIAASAHPVILELYNQLFPA